ncbi:hypothetical protein ACFLWI_06705 [Chloroflexota bacterium]
MKEPPKSYETGGHIRPGDRVVHVERRWYRRGLRIGPNIPGVLRFFWNNISETPFVSLLLVLTGLWLVSPLGVYLAVRVVNEQFHSYGYALWWAFTAMQTQGANSSGSITSLGMLIGVIWAIVGTVIFFWRDNCHYLCLLHGPQTSPLPE